MKTVITNICLLLFTATFTYAQAIRAFGDSFTLGIGANSQDCYPDKLSQILNYPVQNLGWGGQTSTEIANRIIADSAHKNYPTIIWEGYNNYSDSATVIVDVARSVAALGHSKYLIVGVLNTFQPYEYLGGWGYGVIVGINNRLAQVYGTHYVPMRNILVDNYNPSIYLDSVSHSVDAPASTLRWDAKHLNAAGYLVVAQKISQYASILFSSPLPVTFTSIKGIEKNNGVQLTWGVATESNIGRYEIEKSFDGKIFIKGGSVSPKNNIGNDASYEWFDANPANSTNFYRIKSIDNNGEIKYSGIVRVNLNKNGISVSLYPNPAKDYLMANIVSKTNENASFNIYNSTGTLIKTFHQQMVSGTNNFSIDVKALPAGVYIFEYNKMTSRFIK